MTTPDDQDDALAAYLADLDRLQSDVDDVAVYLRSKRTGQPVRLAAQVVGRDPLRLCLLVDPEGLRPVAAAAFAAIGYVPQDGWKVDNYGICEAGEPKTSHRAMTGYARIKDALAR